MNELTVDVSQLKGFAKDLRRAGPELSKGFLKSLGLAGDIVALKAKENAGFSTRIPGSIKVRRRGVSVRVQAGGPKALDAAPLENGGKSGTFRHPVFGNREVWVDQKAHPFLQPALEDTIVPFELAVLAAVDAAFVAAGFNG